MCVCVCVSIAYHRFISESKKKRDTTNHRIPIKEDKKLSYQ